MVKEREINPRPPSLYEILSSFTHQGLFRKQQATWLVKHGEYPLDIGFFSTGVRKELKKIDFLGVKGCVGICLPFPSESEEEFERRFSETRRMLEEKRPDLGEFILLREKEVLDLAEGKITAAQLVETRKPAEKELWPQAEGVGESKEILWQRLEALLTKEENQALLRELSIGVGQKGKLEVLFVDNGETKGNGGAIRLVNIKNVRAPILRANQTGRSLEEVIKEEAMCAGIYVPDVAAIAQKILAQNPQLAESPHLLREAVKMRAYTTAEYIRRSLVPRLGQEGVKFFIPVAFEGQLSLWEKVGFLSDIPPFLPGAVTPKEVIRVLFQDEEGKRQGPLAQLGLSFSTRGVMVEGLDLLFYVKDEQGVKHPQGVSLWGWGKGMRGLQAYNNVVGLVFFSDETPLSERKEHTRRIRTLVRHWLNDPQVEVMGVDRRLVEEWRRRGNPLVSPQELQEAVAQMTPKKRLDYGFAPTGGIEEVKLFVFEKQPQIGGNQIVLVAYLGGNLRRAVILDWGWPFSVDTAASVFPNRPSFELGLGPILDAGFFPPLRRLYRTDLLVKSLNIASLQAAAEGHYSFIVSELYHRLGWGGLRALMEEFLTRNRIVFSEFASLRQHLEGYEKKYYQEIKTVYDIMLASHAHQDHVGGMSLVRFEIPVGLTPSTWAFLEAAFRTGWTWSTQEYNHRKVREQGKKGCAYPVEKRPVVLFWNGQWRKVSPEMETVAYYVNHSIPGATSFVVKVLDPHHQARTAVAYLGDFKAGPLTDRAVEGIKREGAQVLIVEGTNLSETGKPSAKFTEAQVAENLEGIRKQADEEGALLLIQFPPNHLERLKGIIEAAGGRTVAVTFGVAQILHEFAILNERLPISQRLEVPRLGREVVIFKHPKLVYDPWELQLEKSYGAVTLNYILAHHSEIVLLTSQYQLLNNVLGGLPSQAGMKIKVVRSSYWPYGALDKRIVLSNWKFCRRHGFGYLADINLERGRVTRPKNPQGFHASGHCTPQELLDYIAAIAEGGDLRLVLPIHTLRRGRFADAIEKRLNDLERQGIQFTWPRIMGRVRHNVCEIPVPLE